jgi:hypothetical protein
MCPDLEHDGLCQGSLSKPIGNDTDVKSSLPPSTI